MARRGNKRPSPSQDSDNDEEREGRTAADIKRIKTEKGLIPPTQSSMGNGNDSDQGFDYESDESDESSVHEETEYQDEALIQAYEASKERQKGYVGSMSEAGVIKSISLVDFMCHRHLTVDFGPKMNFLVGHNGSGKSAVLTAIAVVLGGKAMTTGRGQGLKDLIRKGADKATITMVLTNSGPEAYLPDVYDPYIVIERILSTNGSSQYKFRANKDGRTIANKRQELTIISGHFNINIDSPLTILTQDQSRSFLQNCDNHKLYRFFLDGTQLTTLTHLYEMSKQDIDQLDSHITRQEEALPDLHMKTSTLKRRVEANKKILNQKEYLKHLLDELAWAYVKDKQTECDRSQAVVDEWAQKVELVQTHINKAEKSLPVLDEQVRQTELEVVNFNESRKPLERAVREAKDKHEQARRDLRSIEEDILTCQKDIASDRDNLGNIQRKIDEKLKQNPAAQQEEQTKLMDRRTKMEELLAKLKKEKPARSQQAEQKRRERVEAQREVEEISDKIADLDRESRSLNENIGNLERQSINRLSAFGKNLDPVMKEIEQTRWHHSRPLGPLGLYVKLNDMFYRNTISGLLGGALCTFAVRSPQDRETLFGILRRHLQRGYRPGNHANGVPPIYTHSGDLYDYSRGDLRAFGPTVLSKLTIEDEHVARVLINIFKIESTFLSPKIEEANAEMTRLLSSGRLPACTFYSADGFFTNGTRSQRSSGPAQKWNGNVLFTPNLAAEIEQVRQKLRECEARKNELNNIRQAAQQKVLGIQQEIKTIDDHYKTVSAKIGPAQLELDKLQRKLNEMVSSDIEVQEGLREDARQKIEIKETQLQQWESDRNSQKRLVAERLADIKARQEEVESLAPQRLKREELLASLVQQLDEQRQHVAHYTRSKDNYEEKMAREQAQLVSLQEHLADWTAKAAVYCPIRVETNRHPRDVEKEKKTLEASIKDAEKQLGVDTNQLVANYQRAKKHEDDSKKQCQRFRALLKILRQSMKNRHSWWSDTRSHTAVRARTAFLYFESQRDLDGRLEFDHEHETLNLVIHNTTRGETEDGQSTQRSHYKTAKTLSGGERSFSTVSLLLALWDTVPCPIRALDEWDVFLDHANRTVAAKSLMDGAKEAEGKQFILITPQDMSGIDVSGPDKKVIRMADPTRNQGILPFVPV